jgi:hypothetical protein
MSPTIRPPIRWDGDNNDNGRMARLNFRLWQVEATALVIFLAAWFCTFGPIPAIITLLFAKHVLVCILMVKLDREAAHPTET